MDLQDVHTKIYFLANKEQHFWPHEEIDDVLHSAQLWLFNQYFEQYGKTQVLHDAMSPFKVKYTFTTGNTPAGVITLPSTYQHLLSAYVQYTDGVIRTKSIRIVNEDELGDRLSSQLKPVSATAPVARNTGLGVIQLYPELPNSGYLFYLKTPVAPVFDYTEAGRVITYNVGTSTQLAWNDTSINQIIIKALQYLGVNLEAVPLVQYTEVKDQQKT